MNWFGLTLKNRLFIGWLMVLLMSALFFLWATIREPRNINANIASFSATLMGAGASGLVAFFLVDIESKRRRDLSMLWHYKSILRTAFIVASLINSYNNAIYKLLKFEDKYPYEQRIIKLVAAKTAERSLNHAVDISDMLNELCDSLKYTNFWIMLGKSCIKRDYGLTNLKRYLGYPDPQ